MDASVATSERRRDLLRRLLKLQEQERREVAHELHEGVGQMLTSLLMGMKVLEGAASLDEVGLVLPSLKEQTWEALETLRLLSVSLLPPLLDDLGLVATVRTYLRDFAARHKVEGRFETTGTEHRLPAFTEVMVFRVVQEALANAAKYAQASSITVTFAFEPRHVAVTVEDDGVGLDRERLARLETGDGAIGILGMQERADFIGGECRVDSAPGHGVRVTLRVPLDSPEPAASKQS